jgi:uncharacterized protein
MPATAMMTVPTPPWWRERMMWLVVGGPLAVVVAALVTAAIAVHDADVVIAPGHRAAVSPDTPAVQARNHAATPPNHTPERTGAPR